MTKFSLEPVLENKQLLEMGPNWIAQANRQVEVARCMGASWETEKFIRDGYKETMRKAGLPVGDRIEGALLLERSNAHLPVDGDEFFDTRRLGGGRVLHVDTIKSFVGDVLPELSWREAVDSFKLKVDDVGDVQRMIELSRVLGLSKYQEEQVYVHLSTLVKQSSGTVLPERNYSGLDKERASVGLDEGESVVNSLRCSKRFDTVEVAAFVKRVLPKVQDVVVM